MFKTAHFNDFSMRMQTITVLFIPVFLAYAGEWVQDSYRKYIYSLLLVLAPLSICAGVLESYYQSKNFELYTVEPSRMFRLIRWTTRDNDIVIINDQYYADRIPIQSFRSTITPVIPYYMSVYMPDRSYKGGNALDAELCSILHEIQKFYSYQFVYVYLLNRKPIECDILKRTVDFEIPYFESAAMKLYKIP